MLHMKQLLNIDFSHWLVFVLVLSSIGCQPYSITRNNATSISRNSTFVEPTAIVNQRSAIKIMVSERGVREINKNTPFDKEGLQNILSDLEIVEDFNASEGEKYPVLKAYREGEHILTIVPNLSTRKIGSVWVTSNLVRNTLGHPIGTRFKKIYTLEKHAKCDAGMEEYSGMVICTAPSGGHIKYLFEGDWNGPDGELPPIKVMALWTLTNIIWIPSNEKP